MRESKKKAARRQELVTRLTEIIERRGYENLTIRDICREAEISIGTFYHYFNEKSDLVSMLFTGIDCYFYEDVEPAFGDDELENIRRFTRSYAQYCVKSGVETCRVINCTPMLHVERDYLSSRRGLSVIMERLVERGREKGQITKAPPVEEIVRMVLVGMRGYCSDWAKRGGSYDMVEAVEQHFLILTRGLRA